MWVHMNHWETCNALERDPEKLGGAWIFRNTRVPVSALFANLRDGATVAEFLEWFPGRRVVASAGSVGAYIERLGKFQTINPRPQI